MPDKKPSRTLVDKVSRVGIKALSALSGVIALILLTYSGYVLYDSFYTQNQAFSSATDLFKWKPTVSENGDSSKEIEDFSEINEDYRAWLTLDGTKIDYPVVQGTDDLYYASHDAFNESSLTGAIYLAAGNSPDLSDNYNIFYGHHMDNGAMFGDLDKFKDKSFFDSHRTGTLTTKEKYYELTTFAVVETNAYEARIYNVGNRDYGLLKAYIDSHSLVNYSNLLDTATKVIGLSTCADNTTNGRLVVFAIAVEKEKPPVDDKDNPDTPPPPKNVDPEESDVPLKFLRPRGLKGSAWALVNLLCIFATAYILIPILSFDSKFGRKRKMQAYNNSKGEILEREDLSEREKKEKAFILTAIQEIRRQNGENLNAEIEDKEVKDVLELLYYNITKFKKHFRVGLIIQILLLLASVITFILTEDMRNPMIIIDQWTPLMLIFLLSAWIIDIIFVRYRKKNKKVQEEE